MCDNSNDKGINRFCGREKNTRQPKLSKPKLVEVGVAGLPGGQRGFEVFRVSLLL